MAAEHPTRAIMIVWIIAAAAALVVVVAGLAKAEGLNWFFVLFGGFSIGMVANTWSHLRKSKENQERD